MSAMFIWLHGVRYQDHLAFVPNDECCLAETYVEGCHDTPKRTFGVPLGRLLILSHRLMLRALVGRLHGRTRSSSAALT